MPEYNQIIPKHELGHCSGLYDFARDFDTAINESSSLDIPMQKNNTNIMGYNSIYIGKPKLDFYSWQIEIIRNNIKTRINE